MLKTKIPLNKNGVALVTVLLITLILSLLAAIAIDTTGTDVINAGQNYKASYALYTANSMMNLVADEISTNIGTNAGIGMPTINVYYYTVANPPAGTLIQQAFSLQPLSLSNINSTISQNLGFQGNAGFEYSGQYAPVPGFSSNKYMFYKGIIYSIANKNIKSTKTMTTGMNFNYGPCPINNYGPSCPN